ncbi:hypothetical protein FVE85_9706 [Porphyridium purpureum]|uniref:Hemerythrin-like domain-containing protein n=1 Tax=Porphyridium purpureum TaxID=35688 RepID=A0A5J4YJS1_PORPP|nr:hypothetical protein FVE85_9706 [Porphyridium purpureum]|eukprot:POR9181..scf246_12
MNLFNWRPRRNRASSAQSQFHSRSRYYPGFHVHGWLWHHMSIEYELDRVARAVAHIQNESHRRQVEGALQQLAKSVQLHDRVERDQFVPWLQSRALVSVFDRVQLRLYESRRAQLAHRLETISVASRSGASRRMQALLNDFVAHYQAGEVHLAPLVAKHASEKEQKDHTSRTLSSMSIQEKAFTLVLFSEAVPQNATVCKELKDAFRCEVPLFVKKTLLPLWRNTIYTPGLGALRAVK